MRGPGADRSGAQLFALSVIAADSHDVVSSFSNRWWALHAPCELTAPRRQLAQARSIGPPCGDSFDQARPARDSNELPHDGRGTSPQ